MSASVGGGPAPIIVSALFGATDFAWLDSLRRAHFPPERNLLPAHLTLFHHLPPSVARELRTQLADEAHAPAPSARVASVMSLGRGAAFRIESPGLTGIRARLADRFAGMLTPQDAAPWRPHVTVQNKVSPEAAHALLADLNASFQPRPLAISGLACWWYRGGSWEAIARYSFRG